MKYRLLLTLVFLTGIAASTIAADSFEDEEDSPVNLTRNNSIVLASSGGETVLSSTLSERGGIFAADQADGTRVQLRERHVQDTEIVNETNLAYISRNLTEDGIDSSFRVENIDTGETVEKVNISRDVNDVEVFKERYRFANSSGIYSVEKQPEQITPLDLEDEAEVIDVEFFKNATVLATQDPDQITVREENHTRSHNISEPEDIQIISLRPLNILVVHESEVIEYKETSNGLEEVWSYSGLENGRAVDRLPNNNTVIADRNTVSAVNSSGEEIWEKEFFSASDIESRGEKVYSLKGADSGTDIDSYWSPSKQRTDKAQLGILEGFFKAGFSSVFG